MSELTLGIDVSDHIARLAIVRRFVWRIKSGDASSLEDRVKGDSSKIAAAGILQGTRAGDGVAISVMRDTARHIGMVGDDAVAIGAACAVA